MSYRLRLYVTGSTPKSARAVQQVRAFCDETLAGRCSLEVIDIYQHPERVNADRVIVTPTLIKLLPLPVRRAVGDLSDRIRLLAELDITQDPLAVTSPAAQ